MKKLLLSCITLCLLTNLPLIQPTANTLSTGEVSTITPKGFFKEGQASINDSSYYEEPHLIIDNRTAKEKALEKEKIKLAEKNLTASEKKSILNEVSLAEKGLLKSQQFGVNNQTFSIASSSLSFTRLLRYNSTTTPEKQILGWWCGPAAAVNAVDTWSYNKKGSITSLTQQQASVMLMTGSQTSLSSTLWPYTMNMYAPGNNYMVTFGSGISNWQATMMANIKLSLDSGYTVVADTKNSPSTGYLHTNYISRYSENGNKPIYHYIVIIGYGTLNGETYYRVLDSASFCYGAYNVSATTLAKMTKELGIVW